MIRDITIGQYYAAESVIHRLDPRVKVAGTFLYIISLFCFSRFSGYIIAALFFCIMVKLSKVPFRFIVRGIKPILFMLVFTAALNLLWTSGETVLVRYGFITITLEGIEKMVFMALRLVFLIIGSSLMTLATTPNQLTDAIESLLKPLVYIKVPVHEVAMMMSIALRFIPILIEETDKIMKAQLARGADFESGSIIHRIKSIVPIIIPLFVSAARRASDLALAMDARCYHGGAGRTKMKPLEYKRQDITAYIIIFCYMAVIIISGRVLPF
ncbi:MAG: energy-coupling factor transporter transmembrane protein EcfT [Lachnospiraceae bacterium]|jgi:ABC-type cobalt transport system, permease component CbiQ and related transporters|nr:energy-coupling factor transporter transmembrane protein EcfT [Lachnospiraceae bacterium]